MSPTAKELRIMLPKGMVDYINENPEDFICRIKELMLEDGMEENDYEADDEEIIPGKITFHNQCEWDGVLKALTAAGYDVEIHVMEMK